jgi:hypothetical protein
MKQKIADILDELLSEMAKGKTIDDCLGKYPDYQDELRQLLQLASDIVEVPKPEPDAGAIQALIRRIEKPAANQKRSSLNGFFSLSMLPLRALAVLFILFIFEVTTVSLSAKSLPGHFLYPVKRFAEDVQHFLMIDSEGMVRMHVVLADRRTNEFAAQVEPGAKLDCRLLLEMRKEIQHAIGHLGELSVESRSSLIEHIYDCTQFQMEVLEKTKECACVCNVEEIEQALKHCLAHRECLECIKNHLKSDQIGVPAGS